MKKNETAKRQTLKTIGTQRKKKKRRTAAHPSKLTPQLEKFMQEAMNHYLNGSFEEAIKILKEVVRRAPGLHDPFHLLGVIYQEEYGDIVTATGYYLLAAHLVQTDLELWRRIGEMSQDIGNVDQAIYCFKKCLKTNEGDINEEVTFALAMCHLEKVGIYNQQITRKRRTTTTTLSKGCTRCSNYIRTMRCCSTNYQSRSWP